MKMYVIVGVCQNCVCVWVIVIVQVSFIFHLSFYVMWVFWGYWFLSFSENFANITKLILK